MFAIVGEEALELVVKIGYSRRVASYLYPCAAQGDVDLRTSMPQETDVGVVGSTELNEVHPVKRDELLDYVVAQIVNMC